MALLGKENKKEETTSCLCGGNCDAESMAKAALEQLGMNTTIDHVTNFSQIATYGVMSTPALVLDGKVDSYGKVLKEEEVVKLLTKVRG